MLSHFSSFVNAKACINPNKNGGFSDFWVKFWLILANSKTAILAAFLGKFLMVFYGYVFSLDIRDFFG